MKRLIAIQQGLKVAKDKQAKVATKNGGSYTYKYRDAEQILEAVKPLLEQQQCAVICRAEYVTIDAQVYKRVRATLYGANGEEIAFADDMVKAPNAADRMTEQQMSGCDTTYCKRYALQNLFAIDNGDDDLDSNNNPLSYQNRQQVQPAPKPTVQPAKPVEQPKKKGLIESAECAIDLNVVKRQLDEYLQAGRMTKEQHAEKELELMKRAKELNCTFDQVEGFIDNTDLFAE